MPIISQSPATDEVFKVFEEISDSELENKLALAQSTFVQWKKTSFEERALKMRKAAEILRARKNELAIMMAQEMGKVVKHGEGEIEKCALVCEYYADNAEKFLSAEKIETNYPESFVRFDPIGAVLAVMPWNFPFWQVFRFAAPALMAGNVGLLKHASNVPQCALAIEEIFLQSGCPAGAFQTLLVGAVRVEKIILDDRIAAVTLTGSELAGSQVAAAAGKAIKKTVLELGGSDPFIVLADADLEKAIDSAATARLQNNAGQSCIAAKRFIVHASVADKFTAGLVVKFKALKIGDPLSPDTQFGPMVSLKSLQEIHGQVEKSVALGAKLECGGKRSGDVGSFYEPTVLSNVKKGMPVFDEEVFGPAAPVITFTTEEEALMLANDCRYGLGATVFTSDLDKAKKMASQIESGAVFVNGAMKSDSRLPFGGIKKSGYGRELSHYGIREFVDIKTVVIDN